MNDDIVIAALWCLVALGAGAAFVLAATYAVERGWL